MDPYEATKAVFSRVQNLDPENASKIMGLLLIRDHGEKEMIRLAFGPENLLHSVVVKARQELGIPPNTPSNNNTINNNNNNFSRPNSSSTTSSSRFGLKIPTSLSIPTLVSPSASSPSWGNNASVFSDLQRNSDDLNSPISTSCARNGTGASMPNSSSTLNPCTPPFYASRSGGTQLMDELQLQEQLSFLNDSSSMLRTKSSDMYFPQSEFEMGGGVGDFDQFEGANPASSAWAAGNNLSHRRSCSVSDINLGSFLDDPASGLGWKPCLYYARGFCKNGSTCRFVHGSEADAAALVGSPSKMEMMEHCHELLRSKSMQQQQKLIAAAMASASSPTSASAAAASFPFSMNKSLSLLAQQQQNDSPRAAAAAAALMMGEDLHKFSRSPRGLENGRLADSSAAARQIYLTFPADSTFREEDVSSYFSIYGPVQDVRIPYQQKRMFGFVTFVYPDTVKMILAKGNPHFVCDARVLVKPYKEKGKVPDKFRKQQQQMEFSSCNSPTPLESRDPFDLPLGARMMYDSQYMLWRRKLEEQADLQQALELQSRRLMGLQLLDVKRNHHHRSLSTGAPPIHSPTQSPNSIFNQNLLSSDCSSPDASDENCASPPLNEAKQALMQQAINEATDKEKEGSVGGEDNSNSGKSGNGKENPSLEDNHMSFPESLEHNLPDSPFASPRKGASEYLTAFAGSTAGGGGGNGVELLPNLGATSANNHSSAASSLLPATTTFDMAPFKSSCYFQLPRFSSGHGAIGM